jgi:hypothetical protein
MKTEVKTKTETGTETGNGQHIHVHIHMGSGEVDGGKKEATELSKGKTDVGYMNFLLIAIVIVLGGVVANKYGFLGGIDNLHLDLNNLNPFPKVTLSPPTASQLQPVAMRCVALDIGMDLNGEPVPASDANIDSIPKQVCRNGCMYEVIPSQAWIGMDNGMMSYTGKFKPIGEVCTQGQQQGQQNGIQKTFLAVIPLYMLGKYLLGEEKSDNETEASPTPTLPNFKVPYLDAKIEEAKTKFKNWLWGVSRVIILGIAVFVFLIGILSSKISRLVLIITGIAMAWYAY